MQIRPAGLRYGFRSGAQRKDDAMNALPVLAQATGGGGTLFAAVVVVILCSRVIPVAGALILVVAHLLRERAHGTVARAPGPTR